jgi:hypothetical protein
VTAAHAADHARQIAGTRQASAGSNHLLIAALAESDEPGARLLTRFGKDPAAISAEAQRQSAAE